MAGEFQLQVHGDVVVVVERGVPTFDDANKALAAAIAASQRKGRKILFDHRQIDLSSYYGFIVRHAEGAPAMGLDRTFRLAHLGTRNQGWLG